MKKKEIRGKDEKEERKGRAGLKEGQRRKRDTWNGNYRGSV